MYSFAIRTFLNNCGILSSQMSRSIMMMIKLKNTHQRVSTTTFQFSKKLARTPFTMIPRSEQHSR